MSKLTNKTGAVKAIASAQKALLCAALYAAHGVALVGCATETVQIKQGEILVTVEGGEEWLHWYSALKKNPPQLALWLEREDGSFAGTIFASRKVATGKWAFSGENPRKEALPVWKHRSSREETDVISGATPRGAFSVALAPREGASDRRFYLWAEFNHSTDWNDYYPEGADEGESGYSGGSEGSGQPSVLYRTLIDLDSGAQRYDFQVVGHGSPDGSDGDVVADLTTLTSALGIVESIVAEVAK